MPWSSTHLKWLSKTDDTVITKDGKPVNIYKFSHKEDSIVLTEWAKHFRNHYCFDTEIDFYREGFGFSRQEFLDNIKFPDKSKAPGPSIRAGDFAEILVADYLEFVLGFWVPRCRYGNKDTKNESTKGCDTLGFKFFDNNESIQDTLAIFEAKAQLTGDIPKSRLQDAVTDSVKDQLRKAESLNAIKQRLYETNRKEDSLKINRFQKPDDKPYKEVSGAAAMYLTKLVDNSLLSATETSIHPNSDNLSLIVIHGEDLMDLVHKLYKLAADEA
jgi:hypothetical protein